MIRRLSYLLAALLAALALSAGLQGQANPAANSGQASPAAVDRQPPSGDSLAPLLRARATLAAAGLRLGPALWPGYRPDTIPVAFLVAGRGVLLVGWPGALPPGYTPVAIEGTRGERSARLVASWASLADPNGASTAARLGGRTVAQVNAGSTTGAALVGLIAHEAFHVFQRATNGAGAAVQENTALMADYPIFDAENERDMALEGILLASALRADAARARTLLTQFLAVRDARQRRLDANIAGFERGVELNEGRAQYVQARATEAAGGEPAVPGLIAWLDSLTQSERSVRGRLYATGAAQALLLDRLAGPAWKRELSAWGGTLQDALAHAVGRRGPQGDLVRKALALHDSAGLAAAARARVLSLRTRRRALADSLLARPGTLLVISGDSVSGIGICGFDPQNMLAAGDGLMVHTRWVRPCAAGLQGDLNVPAVEDRGRRLLRLVLAPTDSVRITIAGTPAVVAEGTPRAAADVRVEANGVQLTARRALLDRRGRELWLIPLRP